MAKLKAGDKMPNLTFDTAHETGKTVLESLRGKKTVFWVLRYIGCTVCRYDVHLIAGRYQEFLDKNAQVFVVMQSDRAHIQKDLADVQLPFDIICDPTMAIYKTLAIDPAGSMEELLGDSRARLQEKGAAARACGFAHGDYEGDEQQLPAMFIVEPDGTVAYAHYAKNIMDMPVVDEVLALL